MEKAKTPPLKLPLREMIKAIPGIFGIRLEEEPSYKVIRKEGSFQVRRYDKMLVAQVKLGNNHDKAVNEGFDILARYIFGENKKKETLSMTTPVYQQGAGQVSEMTTPVLQEKSSGSWMISFVMPAKMTLKTAPVPLDSRVELAETPPRTMAVYRFSGNNTLSEMKKAEKKLKDWLLDAGIQTKAEPKFAQYDQPFAVPFLKRNEVQLEVTAKVPGEPGGAAH